MEGDWSDQDFYTESKSIDRFRRSYIAELRLCSFESLFSVET